MSPRPLQETLRQLLGPGQREVTCEMCFAGLDRYVEAEVLGRDADAEVPGLRAHLVGCAACAEEHESLRALLASD